MKNVQGICQAGTGGVTSKTKASDLIDELALITAEPCVSQAGISKRMFAAAWKRGVFTF